ncbi:MAG: carbon-nitrogen hydrolase family protein [Candidatus Baltobacteraceae bacterium]
MARTLRISALQLAAHDRDAFATHRERILTAVARAAASCDLLVLPEATFPAYVLGDSAIDDGAVQSALRALRDIARDAACTIVVGIALRRDGVLYNSAVAIDRDGSLAGTADKAFLWHFDRKWFAPAESLAPVRTSIGNLGLLICADGRMPAIARALVDGGAEILVMPTAWVTSGRDPSSLENVQADLLGRVRAFENNVILVAANKSGVERGMVAYCGKSQIIASDGTELAMAGDRGEGLIHASVQLVRPNPFRCEPPDLIGVSESGTARSIRVAISIDPLPSDIDARLAILDAEVALAPDGSRGIDRLNDVSPTISTSAERAFDPEALLRARRAGARIVLLDAKQSHPWLEKLARARALELRIYVIVFDRANRRAYAVDPDGTIVAGTFDDYAIAGFSLDARRTSETTVAPGTDVAIGIERIESLKRS